MKAKYLIGGGLVLAGLAAVLFWTGVPQAAATLGGISFSHASHKDVECGKCHNTADSESSGDNLIPKPQVCTECHDAKDVRGYWNLVDNADLNIDVIKSAPRKIVFAHKKHVALAKNNCGQCHGDMNQGDSHIPGMDRCSVCHNNGENKIPGIHPKYSATNLCEACHISLAGLIPQNHLIANFSRLHGKAVNQGAYDSHCSACHSQAFCQDCHSPTNDVPYGQTKSRFYLDGWPRNEKTDDGNELTVQSVHELTYRYTHGFEARAKSSRCATCHDQETFCQPCHQTGYDANGARIVPQSHQLAGFVSISGGRAMNRHAKLARMDIESCASCHNVEGGDPKCALCHSSGLVKENGD
jgi:hypothetical protein